MKKTLIIIAIGVVLLFGVLILFRNNDNGFDFKTDKVTKGDIATTVTATGTVNAVTMVLVGTQVSGTIKQIYVDYNSPVKKGQLIARIDPATFEARVKQARANLLLARANVKKAGAALLDTKRTFERNSRLFSKNFIAKSELDISETNHAAAMAEVSAAKAQVAQSKAALEYAEINLKYTRILSPVDGIVVSRNVDAGQTVAASFQTPTLFTIARDLTKMQIDTNVDEADIGKIEVGQNVKFTVDAYIDITFKGRVSQIRIAPIIVENVVTYNVVIMVDNPALKLKPGMTANVSIITAHKKDVLRVKNTALRFRPPDSTKSTKYEGPGVWIAENKKPKRINIKTGISDEKYTEIVSGDIKEGQDVIISAPAKAHKKHSRRLRFF